MVMCQSCAQLHALRGARQELTHMRHLQHVLAYASHLIHLQHARLYAWKVLKSMFYVAGFMYGIPSDAAESIWVIS